MIIYAKKKKKTKKKTLAVDLSHFFSQNFAHRIPNFSGWVVFINLGVFFKTVIRSLHKIYNNKIHVPARIAYDMKE